MVVITFEYCAYVLYCFVFIRNNSLSIQTACIEGSRMPTISSIDKVTCLSFNFRPLVTSMELLQKQYFFLSVMNLFVQKYTEIFRTHMLQDRCDRIRWGGGG
jgi:hypothetical protein